MKKNIKFIGAAAAALLAVAPVVASTTTANAAVTVNNATATQTTQTTAGTVTVNVSLEATAGKTTAAEALKTAKVSVEGASLANSSTGKDAYDVSIVDESGKTVTGTLEAGTVYSVKVTNLKLKGLTTGENYAIAGGKMNGETSESASNLANNSNTFVSDQFYVFDKSSSNTGNPYVVNKGSYVTSGKVSLSDLKSLTVNNLAEEIMSNYSVSSTTTGKATGLAFQPSAVQDAVRAALKSVNVNVTGTSETFSAPATNFTVNLTAYASNGNSITFPVTVVTTSSTSTTTASPVFKTTNSSYKQVAGSTTAWNLSLDVNSSANAQSIAKDFTAYINGSAAENKGTTTLISVKSSNLNTAVAGKYTVVLTATNPSGKSTDATVNVTVGDPGTTKTVQAGTGTATVVTIDGNKVTPTDTTLANGSSVATYGTVTVNGTSYTRLNSSSSNQYVETQYVDGSIKAASTTSKTIMHIAQYYNNKGEKTTLNGKNTIGAYNEVTVYENPVTINGSKYYQIADSTVYIKAGNVDGTSRKLTHNAYIYNNKGKRVQKNTVLKKGTSKTTYGSAFSIKQNGVKKSMYRIGKNQYVKKANF